MDPEAKRMIEDTYVLAKDNHRLLRAIRRHQILDTFGKWILWIVVIAVSAYSYFVYLKPVVDSLLPELSMMQSGSFTTATTTPLGKLINYFKAGK